MSMNMMINDKQYSTPCSMKKGTLIDDGDKTRVSCINSAELAGKMASRLQSLFRLTLTFVRSKKPIFFVQFLVNSVNVCFC